jgi:hypothetical protein
VDTTDRELKDRVSGSPTRAWMRVLQWQDGQEVDVRRRFRPVHFTGTSDRNLPEDRPLTNES